MDSGSVWLGAGVAGDPEDEVALAPTPSGLVLADAQGVQRSTARPCDPQSSGPPHRADVVRWPVPFEVPWHPCS